MNILTSDVSTGGLEPSSRFELRHASTHRPLLVVVPERRMLVIQSIGAHDAAAFRMATDLLRAVGDLVRSMVIREQRVQPLRPVVEVFWPIAPHLTLDEIVRAVSDGTRCWHQMLELPSSASEATVEAAIDEARRSGGREVPLVRVARITEGPAVQILRVGAEPEASAVLRLYDFVNVTGLQTRGDIHEFVLADANVVGPARARSIFRIPIAYA